MVEVRQSNPDAFQQLNVALKQLDGFEGRVGWGEDAKYEDGTSVAYVAAINELGKHARPFMRPAAAKNEGKWRATAAHAANLILKGKMTGQAGMSLIVQQAESDVLQSIVDVNSPPLSMVTLILRKWRREGKRITGALVGAAAAMVRDGQKVDVSGVSTKPLNDTGHMIATLTSRVESTR